jgi:uncharacterized OB-fold protein
MSKPLPQPNVVTQRFWSSCADGCFEFQHCRSCGHRQFPPRLACTACHGTDLDWQQASGRGAIYSFTVVHRAPLEAFKADAPYVIAIVELEEGVRAMMNLRGTDPAEVTIGMPVEIFFEPTVQGQPPLPQARRRS